MKKTVASIVILACVLILSTVSPGLAESSTTYGLAIADFTQGLVGSSFQFGGTGPAYDASGLVQYVYAMFGAEVPRTVAGQFTVGSAVLRRSDLQQGDIMLFESGSVRWTGIYIGGNRAVWASSSAGSVISADISDSAVSRNLQGARRLPNTAFSANAFIASRAVSLQGSPFQFSAAGPASFDASGLTQYIHAELGINIPRTIAGQFGSGATVTRSQLQPGDLVFFGDSPSSPFLVAVYAGDNALIFASRSEGRVIERSLSDPTYSSIAIAARRYAGEAPVAQPTSPPPPSREDRVIATAESYLGTPYVFGATGPSTFDCSGFTRHVFAQHGISLPRTSLSQASAGTRVAVSQMKKGDLLIFVDTYKEGISHVGIYIEDNQFIHTIPNGGVSYGSLNTTYWGSRLHSVRRVLP